MADRFSYAHAGIGFPNGETPVDFWTSMPGDDRGFLILDSEHWHVNTIRAAKPEALHVLRAMTGKLDNAARIAKRTALHFQPWFGEASLALQFRNEDNLNYERGDNRDDWDWDFLTEMYPKAANIYREVAMILVRDMGCKMQLVFPPWAPGHYLREMAPLWVPQAKQRWNEDGRPVFPYIGFHQYGEADWVADEHSWYLEQFPKEEGYELLLLEHHGSRWQSEGGNLPNTIRQETETLRYLADQKVKAYFFIGQWVPPAESWSSDWDILGNDERTQLFRSPPLAERIDSVPVKREPDHSAIFGAIEAATASYGFPRPFLYGLAEAESSLLSTFEQGKPPSVIRPDSVVKYPTYWPDVSAGPFHKTARWATEYTAAGGGSTYPGESKVTEILDLYRYDAGHATAVAAAEIAGHLDKILARRNGTRASATFEEMTEAMDRYNKPNAEPTAGVKKRYRDSLTKALEFTKPDSPIGEPEMPEDKFEFRFGFLDLANALGKDVVGEPLMDEAYVGDAYAYQFTTRGKMEYNKTANKAHFFAAVLPE